MALVSINVIRSHRYESTGQKTGVLIAFLCDKHLELFYYILFVYWLQFKLYSAPLLRTFQKMY